MSLDFPIGQSLLLSHSFTLHKCGYTAVAITQAQKVWSFWADELDFDYLEAEVPQHSDVYGASPHDSSQPSWSLLWLSSPQVHGADLHS